MPLALLSVSDKTGIVDFARALTRLGWEIVSTGGTAKTVRDAGIAVRDVSDLTGFPEMLDGRVKTLHPFVHGGLLARRDLSEHMSTVKEHGIPLIDLVAVNLYPFRDTIARGGATRAQVIEQIDIGGPSMLRSAAKNFDSVTVVCDPADYARVITAIESGATFAPLREELSGKVYAHTAAYDAAIAAWFSSEAKEELPASLTLGLERNRSLRYGENPDQHAAFYSDGTGGLASLTQDGGKELSFNNYLDLEGALMALDAFRGTVCCAIIKHTTPCGLATGTSALDAYTKALACDPVSAFGSVIAFNVEVDDAAGEAIASLFVECIVAPSFSAGARAALARKKNLRVLSGKAEWSRGALDFKRVRGGMLAQSRAVPPVPYSTWRVASKRTPTDAERVDLAFAWQAVATVKSNAIVLVRDSATIGIGAGQMSRVDASFLAVHKAQSVGHSTVGSVLGSDAYFPFADGIEHAAAAGVTAIVQPGGSVRDPEVIEAANQHDIAMVFTGQRQFRH